VRLLALLPYVSYICSSLLFLLKQSSDVTNMAAQQMALRLPITEDQNSNCGAMLDIPTVLCFPQSLQANSFRSPYLFYLFTAGVEGFYFHLITL
jgi:hypothetical protein